RAPPVVGHRPIGAVDHADCLGYRALDLRRGRRASGLAPPRHADRSQLVGRVAGDRLAAALVPYAALARLIAVLAWWWQHSTLCLSWARRWTSSTASRSLWVASGSRS